ncbi:homolog to bifunctional short chain isoprenyl diphosphate synthase [Halobacterium hubeiense]|uniref:Homolog to bifunctional short chain isoprenyl diphosphate synthase n=2 Tax=Halobacterium TaxID=2239 RepID=A0A0U5CY23_9EURY|nr:hypothetical protein [Halobacterium hubeiense]CQH56586.1 homolog to bifunctional short chain isoprenyl diphosphate synthase [Halobacterium hubeiense]
MTELSPSERRTELNRRLDATLASADAGGLSLARSTVLECPDRWFGQLVALSYDAAADAPDADAALPAATAVELLRGYCRLRYDLLTDRDDHAAATDRDTTAVLLAGDYLNSAAYAAFSRVEDGPPRDGFDALTAALQTIVEGFDAAYARSAAESESLLDDTVGALGEGAAVVGATIAGIDDPGREPFADLGRGFSAARHVQRVLDSAGPDSLLPLDVEERDLRRYGAKRLREAEAGLDRLAGSADAASLRSFLAERAPDAIRSEPQ